MVAKKTNKEAVVAEEPAAVAATGAPAKVKRVRAKKAPAEEAPQGPAASLRKLKGGFQSDSRGWQISARLGQDRESTVLIRFINSTAVMDIQARTRFSTEQIVAFDDILDEIRAEGYYLSKVNSLSEFFCGERQFKTLSEIEDPQAQAQAAQSMGLNFSVEDSSTIREYKALRDRVLSYFKSLTPPYPLAKKPGRNVTNYSVSVKLLNNNNAQWGRYKVSLRQAKMLWERAYKVWNGSGVKNRSSEFTYEYTNKRVQVTDDALTVGCQTIHRYAVEQFAIQQGWLKV